MPPLNADERTTLESWLESRRATLAIKCGGLDDSQGAAASAAPSGLTLTGLVQHMAEVERNWFRRVLAAEPAPRSTTRTPARMVLTAASTWPGAPP
jgi:Protein of unknown function (DUF664)